MGTLTNFLLFSFVVGTAQNQENTVNFKPDNPYVRVEVHHRAVLECCFDSQTELEPTWIKLTQNNITNVTTSNHVRPKFDRSCGSLTFDRVQLSDTGLYQCWVRGNQTSHGTYLQVFKYLEKTINLDESTKNKILTAEGILLLLCVLVPSCTLLFKSKKLNELEKKKAKKEEENIYQGLNLDECWSTYDQIERSQAHGPYQDVGNVKEEEEQIQLEKP